MTTYIPRILFGLWLISIITASLIDYSSIQSIDISTKGGAGLGYHFFGYLVGAALLWGVLRKYSIKALTIAVVLLFLLSFILELLQMAVPYRTFNPMDIAANSLGLGVFYVCLVMWMLFAKQPTSNISSPPVC